MSLINEALKQARVEAARQDAAGKGVPAEALPRYVPERRRSWLAPIVGFVAGLVAVGVAAGAFWMVRGQAQHVPEEAPTQDVSGRGPAELAPGEGQARAALEGREAEHRPEREPARPVQAAPALPSTVPPETPSREDETPPPLLAQTPTPTSSLASTERATEARSQAAPTGSSAGGDVPTAGSTASVPAPVATAPAASPPPTDGTDDQIYLRQAAPTGTTVKLDFIVWSEDPFAQINGELLSAGQSIDGYTLLNVERERVELEGGGERFWIRVK